LRPLLHSLHLRLLRLHFYSLLLHQSPSRLRLCRLLALRMLLLDH
jgi:hypothetical protein